MAGQDNARGRSSEEIVWGVREFVRENVDRLIDAFLFSAVASTRSRFLNPKVLPLPQ